MKKIHGFKRQFAMRNAIQKPMQKKLGLGKICWGKRGPLRVSGSVLLSWTRICISAWRSCLDSQLTTVAKTRCSNAYRILHYIQWLTCLQVCDGIPQGQQSHLPTTVHSILYCVRNVFLFQTVKGLIRPTVLLDIRELSRLLTAVKTVVTLVLNTRHLYLIHGCTYHCTGSHNSSDRLCFSTQLFEQIKKLLSNCIYLFN